MNLLRRNILCVTDHIFKQQNLKEVKKNFLSLYLSNVKKTAVSPPEKHSLMLKTCLEFQKGRFAYCLQSTGKAKASKIIRARSFVMLNMQ